VATAADDVPPGRYINAGATPRAMGAMDGKTAVLKDVKGGWEGERSPATCRPEASCACLFGKRIAGPEKRSALVGEGAPEGAPYRQGGREPRLRRVV